MSDLAARGAHLFASLTALFFTLMTPGDWIAIVFGVVMAIITGTAARIAWSARQVAAGSRTAAKRSADAAERSAVAAERSARATERSTDIQEEQRDEALEPTFEPIPDAQPHLVDEKTAWRVLLRVKHGPPAMRLRWSTLGEGKGVPDGGGREVHFAPPLEGGPHDATVGDLIGAHLQFPTRVPLVEGVATITIWAEELDHETGEPTGRSWKPWRQSVDLKADPPTGGRTKIIV